MADLCPACGAVIQQSPLKVSLEFNVVICGDRALAMTPKEAEVIFSLHKTWPHTMTNSRLILAVWGRDTPEEGTVRNTIYTARLKLKSVGWTIRATQKRGYRLERIQASSHS